MDLFYDAFDFPRGTFIVGIPVQKRMNEGENDSVRGEIDLLFPFVFDLTR